MTDAAAFVAHGHTAPPSVGGHSANATGRPAPGRPIAKRSGPGRFTRRAMKSVRRVHLYTGLFLVPFVVLYGLTGFLFNHPEVWSTSESRPIEAAALDAAGRQAFPAADALAAQVLADLDAPQWQLDDATAPILRGRTFLSATFDGTRHSFVVDEPGGPARLFTRPQTERNDTSERLARGEQVQAGRAVLASIERAAQTLVPAADVGETIDWRLRSSPRLSFGMVKDGEPYEATYDLDDGTLRVTPTDAPRTTRTARSFLLRLHTAHGYPQDYTVSFWWAILVDVMGFAMISWALSGLLMWWQMKNLRRAGAVALALCAVATTWLVLAQWDRLA